MKLSSYLFTVLLGMVTATRRKRYSLGKSGTKEDVDHLNMVQLMTKTWPQLLLHFIPNKPPNSSTEANKSEASAVDISNLADLDDSLPVQRLLQTFKVLPEPMPKQRLPPGSIDPYTAKITEEENRFLKYLENRGTPDQAVLFSQRQKAVDREIHLEYEMFWEYLNSIETRVKDIKKKRNDGTYKAPGLQTDEERLSRMTGRCQCTHCRLMRQNFFHSQPITPDPHSFDFKALEEKERKDPMTRYVYRDETYQRWLEFQ
jgi:hypothetical protein